jgi:hypothetical protein
MQSPTSKSPGKRPVTATVKETTVFTSYSHVDLSREQDAVEIENQRMINRALETKLQAFESIQREAADFKHKLQVSEQHRAHLQSQLTSAKQQMAQ